MLLWVSERMLWVAPGVSAVCGHGHSVVAQRHTARRERKDDVFRGALAGDVWRANTASQNAAPTRQQRKLFLVDELAGLFSVQPGMTGDDILTFCRAQCSPRNY